MTNQEIVDRANSILDKIQQRFPQLATQKAQTAVVHEDPKSVVEVKAPVVASRPITLQQPTQHDVTESSPSEFGKDKVQLLLSSEKQNTLHHNYDLNARDQQKLNSIAVIQAFYGTDIARIAATTRTLQVMLKSDPMPKDWVFVEAQRSKQQAIFSWLKGYGVKYIFRKYTEDSEGLLLKTALWNIGAASTNAQKLCFIDSDVVMCNQKWLSLVDEAFENYDVLSLAGWCYYENIPTRRSIIESIGHKVQATEEKEFIGHIGFNLGLTRQAYEKYGKFEAFNLHDDVWFWTKVFGTELYPEKLGWIPYKTTEDMRYGLPFKVGSTEEVCCHLFHGDMFNKYKVYGYASYLGTEKPFQDIDYSQEIPTWANSKLGRTMKLAFSKISETNIINDNPKRLAESILLEAKKEVYGEIDEDHPLVIMTAFVPDFKHKDIESVFAHKEKLEQHCRQPFTYVCFTDEISTEDAQERGLDVIPFSSAKVKNDRSLWKNEIKRKDIKLPKNTTIVWIDLDAKLTEEFELTRD